MPSSCLKSTPLVLSTATVSQSTLISYRKPTCEMPHSLCHDPRQAPYTSNIPRTLSHDLRQECYTT